MSNLLQALWRVAWVSAIVAAILAATIAWCTWAAPISVWLTAAPFAAIWLVLLFAMAYQDACREHRGGRR